MIWCFATLVPLKFNMVLLDENITIYTTRSAQGITLASATQGSALRSIRERAESLSLLACDLVSGQRIIGQPEKRIIRGGWLGSSAANHVSSAFALQVGEGRVVGAAPVAFGDFEFLCPC